MSCVEKVTTRTLSFVSVILKVVSQFPLEITHFSDQVRIRLSSQLIKGISIVLQKLLSYFKDTAISAFIISALLVLSKNLDLNLNDSESVILRCVTSLQIWYNVQGVFE